MVRGHETEVASLRASHEETLRKIKTTVQSSIEEVRKEAQARVAEALEAAVKRNASAAQELAAKHEKALEERALLVKEWEDYAVHWEKRGREAEKLNGEWEVAFSALQEQYEASLSNATTITSYVEKLKSQKLLLKQELISANVAIPKELESSPTPDSASPMAPPARSPLASYSSLSSSRDPPAPTSGSPTKSTKSPLSLQRTQSAGNEPKKATISLVERHTAHELPSSPAEPRDTASLMAIRGSNSFRTSSPTSTSGASMLFPALSPSSRSADAGKKIIDFKKSTRDALDKLLSQPK
jgi:hypothetical protein